MRASVVFALAALASFRAVPLAQAGDEDGAPGTEVAQHTPAPGTDPQPPPDPIAVRVALSHAAAEKLNELRVLRLLGIELDPTTPLSPAATGPLEGDFIQVWIDLPSATRATLQVRRTGRGLVQRALGVDGYAPDVAARFVAIATAEMVRDVARPEETTVPVKPDGPQGPDGPDLAHLTKIAVSASTGLLALPVGGVHALGGAGLAVEYKLGLVGTNLFGRWLVASGGDAEARWFEVGIASAAHIPVAPGWRLVLGGAAAAVALRLPDATRIDGDPGQDSWTARIAAVAGVEFELVEGAWLGLALEPGASLRSLAVEGPGASYDIGGFALASALGVRAEL